MLSQGVVSVLKIECNSSASTRKCAGGVGPIGPIGPRPGLHAARRADYCKVRYSGCALGETRSAFTCFLHASISARQFLSPRAAAAGHQLPPDASQLHLSNGSYTEAALSCKAQIHSQSRVTESVQGGLGSRQAIALPPTTPVCLNSGAAPAPRRARLGRDEEQHASEHAACGRRAHHAPERAPERKEPPRARSHSLRLENGHAPVSLASNRCERAGQTESDSREAI